MHQEVGRVSWIDSMDSTILRASHALMLIRQECTYFSKILTATDATRQQSRLIIPTASVMRCMWPFFTQRQRQETFEESRGCMLSVIDADIAYNGGTDNMVIQLLFKRQPTTGSFVFSTGWIDYMARKNLMQNDIIILWWDSRFSQFFLAYERSENKTIIVKGIQMTQTQAKDANPKSKKTIVNYMATNNCA